MIKRAKTLRMAASCAALGVIVAGCAGKGGSDNGGGDIEIGVLLPLSGDGATYGEDNRAGIEIALDLFNEGGGLDGKKVKLSFVDVTSPEQAQTEADRLITENDVNVLMGTAFSSLAIPASAAADRRGKVYWELSASADEVSDRKLAGLFQLNAHASALGSGGVEYVAETVAPKLGKDVAEVRAAVISTDDAFGAQLGESMAATVKSTGMQLVLNESYNSAVTDLSPLIHKMKKLDLDVLFASTQERDAVLLYQQSQSLDFYVPVFADTVGFDNPSTAKTLGSDINGAFATTAPVHTAINTDGLTEDGRALLTKYAAAYKEKTGRAPSSDSDLAFGGAWVLLNHVLVEAGGDEPKAVIKAAKALDLPDGSLPNGYGVQFDETGYNTRAFPVVEQWQRGKLAVVSPEHITTADPIDIPLKPWGKR